MRDVLTAMRQNITLCGYMSITIYEDSFEPITYPKHNLKAHTHWKGISQQELSNHKTNLRERRRRKG